MALSNHNIITPIKDSEDFFIVNPLYKSADVISANEVKMLKINSTQTGNLHNEVI